MAAVAALEASPRSPTVSRRNSARSGGRR